MRRKIQEWMVGSDPYVLGLAGDAMLAVLTAAVITGGIRFVVGFLWGDLQRALNENRLVNESWIPGAPSQK
jgi:hypothetical protein